MEYFIVMLSQKIFWSRYVYCSPNNCCCCFYSNNKQWFKNENRALSWQFWVHLDVWIFLGVKLHSKSLFNLKPNFTYIIICNYLSVSCEISKYLCFLTFCLRTMLWNLLTLAHVEVFTQSNHTQSIYQHDGMLGCIHDHSLYNLIF